ncbi:MAG: phosphatidate cytidylyltransferase, partial [Rhodospirillaceae bacterium]
AAVVIVRGEGGWQTLFWLFVVVWSTDIGAYAFGRSIKGPKIAPSISPSKTWSGLLGGMLCAAAGSALFIMFTHVEYAATMQDVVIIASCLAVVAQAGDFLESAIKRRFNVKDSGKIIPGHGGVLDRVDGLMAAACVVAVIVLIREGGIASW